MSHSVSGLVLLHESSFQTTSPCLAKEDGCDSPKIHRRKGEEKIRVSFVCFAFSTGTQPMLEKW